MLRCALITNDERLRTVVRRTATSAEIPAEVVADVALSADDVPRESVDEVCATDPELLIVDLGPDSLVGLRVVRAVAEESPERAILAVGPSVDAPGILEAIRSGATEYVPRPFEDDDIEAAYQRTVRRLGHTATKEEQPGDRRRGATYALFSPKGGTGVTTAATNLAAQIRRTTDARTLLVDLAPAMGTAATLLGLQPRYSYRDVVENAHRMDRDLLMSFLEVHESGLHLLAAPSGVDGGKALEFDDLRSLIRILGRHFEHVVVDAGRPVAPEIRALAGVADHFVLVATPELPALQNLKRYLDANPSGDGREDGRRLVLNRYWDGVGMTKKDVEKALGLSITAVLPKDDQPVLESVNTGTPAVLAGSSGYAKGVAALAEELTGVPASPAGPIRRIVNRVLRPFRIDDGAPSGNGAAPTTGPAHDGASTGRGRGAES